MARYSPFRKALHELDASDLINLKDTSEGWYVEFKAILPNAKSIAKSLSSFANTYGGWLFYGVAEDSHKGVKSYTFPGIPVGDAAEAEQKIAQAVIHHVSPNVTFDHRILSGPVKKIKLPKDKCIIAIEIPQGADAPYVHSSGRIYRRVASHSDPTPETDRHLLDLLWRRGDQRRKALAELLEEEPEISEGEENVSYLELFILPDLFNEKNLISRIDFTKFSELMSYKGDHFGGIPFDNTFTFPGGFIARHISTNDPYNLLFSWKYKRDCSSKITIPLSSVKLGEYENPIEFLSGYDYGESFAKEIQRANFEAGWVIDLSLLYHILAQIARYHAQMMKIEEIDPSYYVKARIQNVWRRIPFLDKSEYLDFVMKYGFPISQSSQHLAPPGRSPDSFVEWSGKLHAMSEEWAIAYVDAAVIFTFICESLGLPQVAWGFTGGGTDSRVISDLVEMAGRALKVQTMRATPSEG